MIIDVNVLLYAVDSTSAQNDACRSFIDQALNSSTRVGFPWPTIVGFLRIATHPRIMTTPLSIDAAWGFVDDWMSTSVAWVPEPTRSHGAVLRELTRGVGGNLLPDAHLAALAIEHGVPLVSCDTDFARFGAVTWINPTR